MDEKTLRATCQRLARGPEPTEADIEKLVDWARRMRARVAELEKVAENTEGECRCALRSAMLLHVSSVLTGNDTGLRSSDARHTVVLEEARCVVARVAVLEKEKRALELVIAMRLAELEVDIVRNELETEQARVAELELREAALFGKQEGIVGCPECGITPEVVAERVSAQYQYRKEAEARVAVLEAERRECLSEMRSCELDVKSPLEGFLASTNALQAEISVANELRDRVAEAERTAQHNATAVDVQARKNDELKTRAAELEVHADDVEESQSLAARQRDTALARVAELEAAIRKLVSTKPGKIQRIVDASEFRAMINLLPPKRGEGESTDGG